MIRQRISIIALFLTVMMFLSLHQNEGWTQEGKVTLSDTHEENSSQNNEIRSILTSPDLTVGYITVTDSEGSDISYSYRIDNIGDADCSSTHTGIYLSTDINLDKLSDYLIATRFTPSINAHNGWMAGTRTTTITNVPNGDYYLFIGADMNNVISESNETNNDYYITSPITIPPESPIITPEKQSFLPDQFALDQNYPNPFNSSTTIRYSIPVSGYVTLNIYTTEGRIVKTLIDAQQHAGRYEILCKAKGLPSGIYLYRLEAGSYIETKKLILQR